MGRRSSLFFAALAALLTGALATSCDPDLNENECITTAECAFRPGTVCSPEGWCVLPEAARPDQGVEPDMRVVVPVGDTGPAVDAAPGDTGPMGDAEPGDTGPMGDAEPMSDAEAMADMDPEVDGGADGGLPEDGAVTDDMGSADDMAPTDDMAPIDDMAPADAGAPSDAEPADGEFIEPADALPAMPT